MNLEDLFKKWFPMILAVALLSTPVSADYYKYVDKNGTVHYTDDISNVPEEYQEAALEQPIPLSGGGIKTNPAPGTDSDTALPQDVRKAFEKDSKQTKPQDNKAGPLDRSALLKKKKGLQEEYTSLIKERETLTGSISEWSKRYRTRGRKSVARAKLNELQQKQSDWEKRFNAWKARSMAVDAQLKKSGPAK